MRGIVIFAFLFLFACDSGSRVGSACTGEADCGPEEWCEANCLDMHGCNEVCSADAPVEGVCAPRPESCDANNLAPTCGCDGKLYESACQAQQAGVRPNSNLFGCSPPDGSFACGNQFCSIDSEYCLVIIRGTLGSYSRCEPIFSACAGTPIDCDCLTKETLAKHADLDSCMGCQDSGQGLELTCG